MPDSLKTLQREIVSEYDRDLNIYKDFADINLKLFNAFIKENAISVYSIDCHIVDRETLVRKLSGPYQSALSINEIDDLVSIRVLTFFEDDADNISEVIGNEFNVIMDYFVKPETKDPKRFGYYSRRYTIRMLDTRLEWIEYRRFKNLKLRIEVKSLIQHAWSEFQGQLFGEEGKTNHPELLRACYRVVGILELADNELKRIKSLNNSIKKKLKEPVSNEISVSPNPISGQDRVRLDSEMEKKIPITQPHVNVIDRLPVATAKIDSKDVIGFDKISDFVLNDLDIRNYDRKIADMYDVHLEYRETFVLELSKVAAKFSHFSFDEVKKNLKKHMKEIDHIKDDFLPGIAGGISYMARGMSLLYIFYVVSSIRGDKETMREVSAISKTYGD
ncbi:MAG: RelA/SpoT domain protein [Magnetococcales bacterium]|nr:RelA/SpoT domain protein [Magnetococcales bacterium]HIJ82778.1 RelA/SpoT domain-containing protein [Magnetococcales bacterium]